MATLRQFLERHRAVISDALYPMTAFTDLVDDVVRHSQTEDGKAVDACDPDSIVEAVRTLGSWPVRIARDGAALVVTVDTATPSAKPRLIAMLTARAKVAILRKYARMEFVNAKPVYEGEIFVERQGSNPGVEHTTNSLSSIRKRQRLIGACAIGQQRPGTPFIVETMDRDEIDTLRLERGSRELREGDLDGLDHAAQYVMAKVLHRFAQRVELPDNVRAWFTDARPLARNASLDALRPLFQRIEGKILRANGRQIDAIPAADLQQLLELAQRAALTLPPAGTITVPVQDPRGVIEGGETRQRPVPFLPVRSPRERRTAEAL